MEGCRRNKREEKKEESEGKKEEVKRRREREGRGGGDYTIIQITAGHNLVADVSWSTMPTTHRRACVCVRVCAHIHTWRVSMPSEERRGEEGGGKKIKNGRGMNQRTR